MLPNQHAYLSGGPPRLLPLARFLPPIPEGMAAEWLRQNIPPGGWVLDPLGASPALVLEAAQAGYRIIVSTNNPILSFMIEVLGSAPQTGELQAAIAALAVLRRGSERLEVELKGLYETRCPLCGQITQADGYLWQREAAVPYACLYHCPACNEEGEHPPTDFDLEKLDNLGSHSLHYARALERVNVGDPQVRQGAEEALKSCLPRQLYVISTLINKTASLNVTPRTRQLLHALILSVCDQGNTLWAWPSARSRPRQLTTPPRFRESNLWKAFEAAVLEWQSSRPPLEVTRWPQLPQSATGICIYSGRPGALLAEANPPPIVGVISGLPRPAQAFWTFSALWSGWLWGQEAVVPMKSALERRRYDWAWHAEALYRVFRQLQTLPPAIPLLSILPELETGFLGAAVVGLRMAGLQLHSLALQEEDDLAQLIWETSPSETAPCRDSLQKTAQAGMLAHLAQRREPASRLVLEAAALAALAAQGCLSPAPEIPPGAKLSQVQKALQEILEKNPDLQQAEDNAKPYPTRVWWPARAVAGELPLSDRVEKQLLQSLLALPAVAEAHLLNELYSLFPGLLTPSTTLVTTILSSYAHHISEAPPVWQLNEQERPAFRQADLQTARKELLQLGKTLDYEVTHTERSLEWVENGQPAFLFQLLASSIISPYVLEGDTLPKGCRGVLVFPGSRSHLLAYKLLHNPQLARGVAHHWVFLKLRHLRRFLQQASPTRSQWQEHLTQDPPLWDEATQMRFFE